MFANWMDYTNVARRQARLMRKLPFTVEELEGTALNGLHEAAKTYNPSLCAFGTWAVTKVRTELRLYMRWCRHKFERDNRFTSLNHFRDSDEEHRPGTYRELGQRCHYLAHVDAKDFFEQAMLDLDAAGRGKAAKIVKMHFVDGMTYKQIGAHFDVNWSTAAGHFHSAMKFLRERHARRLPRPSTSPPPASGTTGSPSR